MTSRIATRPATVFPVDLPAEVPAIRVRPRVQPWLLFTVTVVVAFFALIYSRIALDRTAFDLQKLNHAITVEETRHWELRSEVARLQAPERITSLAAEMGMVYPTERVALAVEGSEDVTAESNDLRWANLKALLSASP